MGQGSRAMRQIQVYTYLRPPPAADEERHRARLLVAGQIDRGMSVEDVRLVLEVLGLAEEDEER
jgi:hypothetical protein